MNPYIVEFNPIIIEEFDYERLIEIEKKISCGETITLEEADFLLENLVYVIRKKLNPNMDDFSSDCSYAQGMIYYYFQKLNISTMPLMSQVHICKNSIAHQFILVTLNVMGMPMDFLIDPTYIQFFFEEFCHEGMYVNLETLYMTPTSGYFIEPNDMELTKEFLDKGYMFFSEEIARIYGNSLYNTGGIGPTDIENLSGEYYITCFKHFGPTPVMPEMLLLALGLGPSFETFEKQYEYSKDKAFHQKPFNKPYMYE